MLGSRFPQPRRPRDEGERPFWISYSDLMTALMMLFLVVMAVSLFTVSSRGARHEKEIDTCMAALRDKARGQADIHVSIDDRRVSFGEKARFAHGDYRLSAADAKALRAFAPVILDFADSPSCGTHRLLRQVVVEGYTSTRGSYFYNLDLSLKRAQEVMCALLDGSGEPVLTDRQKDEIRRLFLVGGYSYNAQKESEEASRRVELQLEFRGLDEKLRPRPLPGGIPLGDCPL